MQTKIKILTRWIQHLDNDPEEKIIEDKVHIFVEEILNDSGLTPQEVGFILLRETGDLADRTADHENDLIRSGEATEDEL